MSDREQLETSRAYGLRKRHETRLERANEHLVKAAYEAAKGRILAELDAEVRKRDGWIAMANSEIREFWLKMRARGIPDRLAEREAYQRLADEIREIGRLEP